MVLNLFLKRARTRIYGAVHAADVGTETGLRRGAPLHTALCFSFFLSSSLLDVSGLRADKQEPVPRRRNEGQNKKTGRQNEGH